MSGQFLLRNVPQRTQRWLDRESRRQGVSRNSLVLSLLENVLQERLGPKLFAEALDDESVGIPDACEHHFTFIDLFAGIGGLRLGLESAGGKCLFSCEIDPHAQQTYEAWFGERPVSDIRDFVSGVGVPHHDVLAAGFPCQPFSIAGVSKKNSLGREHGFNDKAQGTLFFQLATMIEIMKPPVLLLENVKNLRSHNKGDTWRTIAGRLDELGYSVFDKTIDAAAWVPQHRERIFIVGLRREVFGDEPTFEFPRSPSENLPKLADILEPESNVPEKYTLSDKLWEYLQQYALRHKAKGNGFGFGLADRNGITRTLSARYYKDGSEILIPQVPRKNPRRLMPVEAARLMGFPDRLANRQVVSDTQAYRQFGNAVVPKVVAPIARQIANALKNQVVNAK